jgi:predicted small metal-binding protein
VGADCDYTICAKTEQEIFEKAKIHAKESHHLDEIPKELYDRARSAIREGS